MEACAWGVVHEAQYQRHLGEGAGKIEAPMRSAVLDAVESVIVEVTKLKGWAVIVWQKLSVRYNRHCLIFAVRVCLVLELLRTYKKTAE